MEINNKRIVLTGAAGGMGSILAAELVKRGANLAMVDANADALTSVAAKLSGTHPIAGDLSSANGCRTVADHCLEKLGGVDMLINLAGINSFAAYEDESPEKIEAMIHVNLLAPMWLAHAFLPVMQNNNAGTIVNVGSTFGSIGFAYFSVYSASKFGLRGFSEALRREVADTDINVTYIAPRAVKTPINSDALIRMGEATKMNMDAPEDIVKKIISAIENNRKDIYFGFPESFFVRINAILPRLVDNALAAQNRIARAFAKGEK